MPQINHPCQAQTVWTQTDPTSIHAYRVSCGGCGKFLKWGTAHQLTESRTDGGVREVIKYKAPASLEAFFA